MEAPIPLLVRRYHWMLFRATIRSLFVDPNKKSLS